MSVALDKTMQICKLNLEKWREFLRGKGFEIFIDEASGKESIDSKMWKEKCWILLGSDELKLLEFQHNSFLHIPRGS